MKEQFEKYSPKWLLHRILEAGDNHGEALMYILEFQRELIKNCTIPHVVGQSEQLCDLDGKKVLVKFKVNKHIPKIVIEDI